MLKIGIIILLIISIDSTFINIPGCPSLYQFDFSTSDSGAPKCYCDNSTDNSDLLVQINCLITSNIKDLANALDRVSLLPNKQITDIHIEKMIFDHEGIPDDFFSQRNARPKSIGIANCITHHNQALMIGENAFRGLENNLTSISIRRCNLTSFPQTIRKLSKLENLEIEQCQLKNLSVEDFSNLKKLKSIHLSGNDLHFINNDIINNWTEVVSLHLSDNYLKDDLITQLGSLTNLIDLDLSLNYFTFLNETSFSNFRRLRKLNLAGNAITHLTESTFKNFNDLQVLDFRDNGINYTEVNAFGHFSHLTHLLLAGNYFNEISLKSLGLKPGLKFLDLGRNKMNEIKNDTFSTTPNLIRLDLSSNEILHLKDNEALSTLPTLEILNISHTNMSLFDKDTLKKSINLSILDLSYTQISQVHKNAFENFPNLASLYLSGTQLKTLPDGIFQQLPNLNDLDLSRNSWKCDRDLIGWLPKWIVENYINRSMNIENLADTICLEPESLKDKPLVQIFDPNFELQINPLEDTFAQMIHNTTHNDVTHSPNSTTANQTQTTPVMLHEQVQNQIPIPVNNTSKNAAAKGSSLTIILAVVLSISAICTVIIVLTVIMVVKRNRLKQMNNQYNLNHAGYENGGFTIPHANGIEMKQKPELIDKNGKIDTRTE